jgi:hypothetical protein
VIIFGDGRLIEGFLSACGGCVPMTLCPEDRHSGIIDNEEMNRSDLRVVFCIG